jgi:hypothetical protein
MHLDKVHLYKLKKYQHFATEGVYKCSTTTSICPWADFSFVPGIFAPVTNALICTSSSHRPVQMSPHRGVAAMPHICTGRGHAPV